MLKRVIVSILVLPCLAVCVYLPLLDALPFFLFLMAVCVLGSLEFARLQASFHPIRGTVPWFVAPPAILLSAFFMIYLMNVADPFIILFIGTCVGAPIALAYALFGRRGARLAGFSAVNVVYLGVFPVLILANRQEQAGVLLTFFLFLTAWGSDAAAYLIGSRFGKTKGIVSWSPNKSVEGFAGAFVFTLALAAGFKLVFRQRMPFTMVQTLTAGLVIAVTAPVGDLLESLLKRKAGVKDSSRIVPGMGGVLDVFDSILFSAPFFFTLRTLF